MHRYTVSLRRADAPAVPQRIFYHGLNPSNDPPPPMAIGVAPDAFQYVRAAVRGRGYRDSRAPIESRIPGRRHPRRELGDPEDRKSTRLNSSHVAISYAVFCLKKKKHIIMRN